MRTTPSRPECTYCNRDFPHWDAYNKHMAMAPRHQNPCDSCKDNFPTPLGLKEHYVQSSRHSYCQYCDTHHADQADLEQHFYDEHGRKMCKSCNRNFKGDLGLREHYRQFYKHKFRFECYICNQHHRTLKALEQHLASDTRKHEGWTYD